MTQKRKITWLIYHEPIGLFLRTANAFCEEIKQLTNGRIEIEVLTVSEYYKKHKIDPNKTAISLIEDGAVQMGQVYTNIFGTQITDFFALAMPFLFRDHDHAAKVLEGEIGQKLLNKQLPEKTDLRGLAFTYSGGFCVMASNKKIQYANDLKGLTLGIVGNPVFADMATAFGSNFEILNEFDQNTNKIVLSKEVDTVQTTLARYGVEADSNIHKHITNIEHTLYLTTIVINEEFWNTLTVEDQIIMRQAALNSARKERAWSIEDNENIANDKNEHEKLGIESFNMFDKEEKNKLKNYLQPLYKKYNNFFSTGLIDSIRNT